jgi:hypothetical protein
MKQNSTQDGLSAAKPIARNADLNPPCTQATQPWPSRAVPDMDNFDEFACHNCVEDFVAISAEDFHTDIGVGCGR